MVRLFLTLFTYQQLGEGKGDTHIIWGRELHLDFTEEFRAKTQEQQASSAKAYIQHLQKETQSLPEDNSDRQGMLNLQQVSEHLLPHLTEGEIPLTEIIVIELQSDSSLGIFIPQ
jgi:hypothetical protein